MMSLEQFDGLVVAAHASNATVQSLYLLALELGIKEISDNLMRDPLWVHPGMKFRGFQPGLPPAAQRAFNEGKRRRSRMSTTR